MLRSKPVLFLAAISLATSFAQPLPLADHPEDVGFSSPHPALFVHAVQSDVDSKRLPGAVLLIGEGAPPKRPFTVQDLMRRNPMPGSVGALFRVDPQSKLVAVFMSQAPREMLSIVWRELPPLVYQAIVD